MPYHSRFCNQYLRRPLLINCLYLNNPQILNESDYLWQKLCQRQFKFHPKRLEMETWRDLFHRCKNEEKAKLTSFVKKYREEQSKKMPESHTKIIHADKISIKKRFCNVINKSSTKKNSSARINETKAENISRIEEIRNRTIAALRSTTKRKRHLPKIKKGPLMTKLLKRIKR